MTKKAVKRTRKPPAIDKQSDVPASQGQLEAVRAELKSDITSLKLEMNSNFKGVDAQFKSVDAQFKSVDAQFKSVDARFDELKSMITDVATSVHAVKAIVEEQNARNKFVIDGYKAVIDVQQDHAERISRLEKSSFGESEI